jgi:putative transcriptional regulator
MSASVSHHVDAATLLAFSAGTLNEALSAVVAAHVHGCPDCATEVDRMDLVGATLLATMAVPMQGTRDTADKTPPFRDTTHENPTTMAKPATAAPCVVPAPIRAHFGIDNSSIRWKQLAPGVWHHRFKLSRRKSGDLRLLKIAPGYRMLEHGHGGTELTLVLDGAYSDSTGEYLSGDIQEVAEEIEHCPIADRVSGCICLIASEEPARFRGVVGRIVQLWTGL